MDRKRKKRSWRRVTNALSCLIVFCTTYALILPALTLETEAQQFYCDKEEHTHTEDCYHSKDPLCGKVEGEAIEGHVHDDSCYEIKQTLICPLEESEEHVHDESCFQQEQVLICDKEESESVEGHEHSPKCYLSVDPVCGKEEHTHSKECTSNKDLKEKKEDWENSIPETLSDKLDEKIVQIAKSQKDYKEVKENFELDSDGKEHYYTRYGEWYGKPYEDWNIMFASFVLHYAGIKNEQIPYGHDWNEWIEDLSKKELFEPEGYAPQNGDLIFFKDQKDENVPDKEIKSYVGILVDQDKNKVIVGDLNDQVKEIVLQDKEYETMVYVHPEQEVQEVEDEKQPTEQDPVVEDGKEEPAEEEKEDKNEETKEEIEYRLPEEFKVETEDFTLTLKPRSIPGEKEETEEEQKEENKEQEETEKPTDNELQIKKFSLEPEENIQDKIDEEINRSEDELEQIQEEVKQKEEEEQNKPVPTLQIEKIDETTVESEEDQLEIQKLKEQSEKDTDPEQLLDLSFYKLRFFVEDQEINLEDQKFDAELTPTQAFVEKYDTTKDLEDVKPEAEVGTEFSLIQTSASIEENKVLKAEKDNTSSYLLSNESVNNKLSFSIKNSLFGARASSTPNPNFKVQTYANIKENVKTKKSDSTIPVVDMTQKVPTVGENVGLEHYQLTGEGRFEKKTVLKKIYNEKEYKYHSAPNISYFDILIHNGNYKLKQIWILKSGKNEHSVSNNDWTIYTDPTNIHFTNRTETYNSEPTKYILINNNSVIRLVYDQSNSNFSSQATFYDYDITNDGTQTRIESKAQGINIHSNYSGKGSKYAFGNSNTGTGLETQKWKDANLNKSNTSGHGGNDPTGNGFVFGMVDGVDSNGNLIWADEISAPKIFGTTSQIGKTVYSSGNNLKFTRQGDSYVLKAVSGNNVKSLCNLDKFNHPKTGTQTYDHIWTNNFWPLDSVKNTDPHAGTYDEKYTESKRATETYTTNGVKKHYPPGDDGLPHNNLFGMTYDIDFTLDKDYVGPLEYFFYGDDDLWVFLGEYNESTKTYENYKKICDLGGVKSSRGAHVNLRDSLLKVVDQKTTKKYRLKIYYTERGNSGSTCYMEFTLPSVSGAETGQATGGVNVYKYTEDEDTNSDFSFNIKFSKNGVQLKDDYAYTKYDSNGTAIEQDLIIASDSNFTLKKGEYISVSYLPIGTTYTISEINVDPTTKVYTSSSNSNYVLNENKVITGTIVSGGNTASVYFKNVRFFKLPETGGLGINPSILAGGASLMTTSIYIIRVNKKGRWKSKKKR